MPQQSLYRKYRPQTFDDVVGQDHITTTLRNALDEKSVSHAYLFCGPRGTGKTTTARILAKALDCEKGPSGQPDDTCASCRDIAAGRHPDVYELDAASRTGVDAVRDEIITKVNYAATRGPYKVYIIDEVHMLSTSAFNALLKTLEEPPSHAFFVLCTTHPNKVPETIHSRCQRFDFRRISVDDIASRLADIAKREAISTEEGSLPLIARHAAGGMRDAIGTLEQLSAFTGKSITLADVEGLLGEVDSSRLREAVSLIRARDVAGLFGFTSQLVESGHDVSEFVRGLTGYVRDLYVTVAAQGADVAANATSEDASRLREQASSFEPDRLARLLDVLGELAGELRWAPDARLALEIAFVRMARPASDLTLDALAERISALEAGAPVAGPGRVVEVVAPPASAAAEAPPAKRTEPAAPRSEAGAAQVPEAGEAVASPPDATPPTAPEPVAPRRAQAPGSIDRAAIRRVWPDVLREVKTERPALSKLFLDTEVDLDGDEVVVELAPGHKVPMRIAGEQENTVLLQQCIERVTGVRLAIRYQLGRGAVRHPESPGHAVAAGESGAGSAAQVEAGSAGMLMDALGAELVSDADDPHEDASPEPAVEPQGATEEMFAEPAGTQAAPEGEETP